MNKDYGMAQAGAISLSGAQRRDAEAKAAASKTTAPAAANALAAMDPAAYEESRKLVQKLFLAPGQAAPKVVVFAASDAKNDCSRLCALAAKVLAESVSGPVCLVEGNYRTPALPGLLGVDNHHGLMDSLRRDGAIREFAKPLPCETFWLLSAGAIADDAMTLFNGNRMKERFEELRREFQHVIIDAPPLNAYAEGLVLGRLADGVVLVLEANSTRREAALRVAESLRAMQIPLLGAVLNNRTFPIPAALYKRL